MSEVALPAVAEDLLVQAVDALPARLRRKLDEAVAKFAGRQVTSADGRFVVAIDDATTVTLVPEGGVVRSADAATCSCLLAPNCLHRVAILALAPVAAPAPEPGSEPSSDAVSEAATDAAPEAGAGYDTDASAGGAAASDALSGPQSAAVERLWEAAAAVLSAGVNGAGTVARTALLRAAHDAQAAKVHRPAAAARVVATLLQAARSGAADYRLADLVDALRELLGVTHRLRRPEAPPVGLLGTARRAYEVQGSLRLYGLCTTAVLADTGYAGVVTHVVDRDGGQWMIADLMPGDARRAATAGNATIAMGETALSHRALTRAGLVVSGATASTTRQLGAGKAVRAVTADGVAWHEEPIARLWAAPLAEQVHRAFEALALPVNDRPAGSDLVYLSVEVHGTDGDAVLATTTDGIALSLCVADDHPALAYRENLQLLGRTPGLRMLIVARPDPSRRATVLPLAVAPPDGIGWSLPASLGGHVDLAYDRLHRSHLPTAPGSGADPEPDRTRADEEADHTDRGTPEPGGDREPGGSAEPNGSAEPGGGWRPETTDPALRLMRAQVERTVAGGRSVLTLPAGRGPSDAGRLRRARLETGAEVLDRLTAAACHRPRDAFGRLAGDDGTGFAQAWLAAAVYADAASRAFAEASWLPDNPLLAAPVG